MDRSHRVVIGVPAYGRAGRLPEALEALLSQQFADFAVVAVDDASSDDTLSVLQSYAARDRRIVHVSQNPRRVGMIENFRRTFRAAEQACPDMEYFAWASDHDVCHPFWLEALVQALEADSGLVLAYPMHLKFSEEGHPLGMGGWSFDTCSQFDRSDRFRAVLRHMSAGNMIYGLFRASALRRAGVKRRVLLPDRLLMAELSLFGRFKQVPEFLWYRRHVRDRFSLDRQRRSLFGPKQPLGVSFPWRLTHTAALIRALVSGAAGLPDFGRSVGLRYALQYAAVARVGRSGQE